MRIDCEEGDSLQWLCYDTYALFLEYAELGYDYDSVTTKLKKQVENLETDVRKCQDQQGYLKGIINDLNEYITHVERQLAKERKKLKIMKILSYSSLGTNAVLALILILKN